MKKRIIFLLLTLCLILSVFALASCGKKGKTGGGEQTTAATTDKWEILAPRITMLPEADRQLKIECSSLVTSEKGSKNDVYLKGPDTIDAAGTPAIQMMIYERNRNADNLFGTTTNFVFWNYGYGKQAGQINLVVQGHDPEAPDLFVNMIYDLNMSLMLGHFKDVWSIPNSFFDFSATGWLTAWMENMSLTGDRAYILGSDYFLDVFRSITALPFNMDLMDNNAAKLGPVILDEGESLGSGEKLSAYFIDFVEKGNWTWDVLGKLCEASWVDKDGDGQTSIGDDLGIIADRFGGINAASFLYSCGEQHTEAYTIRDDSSAYNGKQWIRYPEDSTSLNQIFDKVKSVFEGDGALSTSYTFKGNTPEEPGAAYHHTKFALSELLFAGVCTLGTLEDATFQNMKDLYSVVPCPKVDVSKSYNTIIINQADAGAINVHTTPAKAKALTAYLQYCTERSVPIREEFLQIVMKYKVATHNQGTDRMLDLIYDSILYGRDKTVEDLVCPESDDSRGDRWHSVLKEGEFCGGSSNLASQYKALRDKKQAKLDEYMAKWYGLPKVEPNAE